jgi:hypothetical protein
MEVSGEIFHEDWVADLRGFDGERRVPTRLFDDALAEQK